MKQRLKILNIVGARPNLPKIAPLMREMQRHPEIEAILVHTGQHYDETLSDIFFRQMGIPSPHVNLEVGSGSHASQTAEILRRIEPVLVEHKPNIVLVVGDVNSTVAVSLAAAKLGIRVAHVEAGLRSFDRTMPSFAAARETATVELTSPTTRTMFGLCSTRTGSMRLRISAVCDAWEPEPTSRFTCGEGMPIWRKKMSESVSS